MLMLSCTKVLRPGLPRLGKIGDNFVLPRTIHLPSLFGGMGGGLIGLMVGLLIVGPLVGGMTTAFGVACIGALAGIWLVSWQPWKGENIGRVAIVRARAITGSVKTVCAGSARLPDYDSAGGQFICKQCALVVELEDDLVPMHDWKRRLYTGIMEVQMPQTGVKRIVPGSVPGPAALEHRQPMHASRQ